MRCKDRVLGHERELSFDETIALIIDFRICYNPRRTIATDAYRSRARDPLAMKLNLRGFSLGFDIELPRLAFSMSMDVAVSMSSSRFECVPLQKKRKKKLKETFWS